MTAGSTMWLVDDELHRQFVTATGDSNPIHVDELTARRMPFGRVVVHGMHLLLEVLERTVAATDRAPRHVRATFRRPVGIGDPLTIRVDVGDDCDSARCTATVGGLVAVDITSTLLTAPAHRRTGTVAAPPVMQPADREFRDLEGLAGRAVVAADAAFVQRRFPHLVDVIGIGGVAEFITLTRIVGMDVPGLHSMFSSLDVSIDPSPTAPSDIGPDQIDYEVVHADQRFARVTIAVGGPSVRGSLVAFVRSRPIRQLLSGVRPVAADEFRGWRVLVIGGSRGLGALAVQLLVLGGADVRFTYRVGADDATAVTKLAPSASAHRFDVLEPDSTVASVLGDDWWPTHLAYFATPPIFDGGGERYSPARRKRFDDVYVNAFSRLIGYLGPERLKGVLFPSSVAVVHAVQGLTEYAESKLEAERCCAELAAEHPHLVVHAPRFPRLLTDQTTSFVPSVYGDSEREVLDALRVLVAGNARPIQ